MKHNPLWNTLAIILAVGVILFAFAAVTDSDDEGTKTITVSGEAKQTVAADKAEIRFSVITENEDSSTAASENAKTVDSVIAALKEFGEVETESYYLSPQYDWRASEVNEREPRIMFYRATNTVVLKTTDLELVGDAIDAATQAGANNVQGLQFMLSDEEQERVRSELYAQAATHSRTKAENIAKGLHVDIEGVASVMESGNSYPIYYARLESMDSSQGAGTVNTKIEPGTLDIQVNLQVEYLID